LRIDEETADKINESLKGKLFDFGGAPKEAYVRRISETADRGYAFYPVWGSGALYDQNGNMVLDISWNTLTLEIELIVSDEIIVYTYAEAAALLGREFGVPDIPGFSVRLYHFCDDTEDSGRVSISAVFINKSSQTIDYTVEIIRPGGVQYEWRLTGTIEEIEINGVIVTIQRDSNMNRCRYFWQAGDVSYCMIIPPLYDFPDDECLQVIASMLT